jgi:hypothetical protein
VTGASAPGPRSPPSEDLGDSGCAVAAPRRAPKTDHRDIRELAQDPIEKNEGAKMGLLWICPWLCLMHALSAAFVVQAACVCIAGCVLALWWALRRGGDEVPADGDRSGPSGP